MGRSLVESGVNLALKNSHRPTRNNPRWLQLLLTLALVAVMLGIDQGVHTPNAGAASPITYIASELSAPRMMALDSSGDLFIADYSSNTVAVLAKTSGTIFGVPVTANKLTTIVSSGLSGPEGIALDTAGDLFITNNTAGTVSVMPAASGTIFGVSVTANTLTTLISSGLSAPIGLVLDSAGDLFIANNTASTVSVMPAASGTIFGVSVTANTLTTIVSGLSAPSGLVFDSAGDLFISNVGGNSVSVMPIASGTIFGVSVTANTLASVVSSGLSGPEGLAFNISGDLFIANNSTNKVSAIAPSGGSIFGVAVAANTLASIVTTGLSAPEGLAFDAGGDLFISNSTANNISAMPAASGTIFGVSVTANSPATIASGLNGPGALAIDSAGNLYVTNETGNSVDVMPVTSGTIFGVPVTAGILATIVSSGLGQPDGLAFDSAGDLFIANFTANTVSVVPAASGTIFGVSVTANVLSVIASGLSGPAGLSFNSAGDLFIANSTASSISVMPIASGTIFGVSVTANTLASVVTSGLSIPNGLSFNLAGDLFIANNSGNSVSVMPQASGTIFGVSVTANTLASVASTGLSAPLGITIDSAGDLFIANNTANSVSELLAFHPVPTVTAVDPAIGSTSGGDVVDIVGSGFVAGSTTVDFGTAPATSVSLGSGDQLTAVSPPGFVGTIDVTVTTPGGTSTTSSADKFEYVSSVATAFVTNQSSGTVTPISTATNTASSSITVGTNPEGIAITPNGTTAYVANNGSGTVTLFNTAIGFTGSPITVGANPIDIAITPNGATAYVVNYSSSTVTPINTSTNVAGSPITVATQPYAIAITPNGAAAYVVSYGSGTVTPISTATNTAGSPITVGATPEGIAITPNGATAYVTNAGSGTVTPINTATNTAGSPITVGATPEGIAITPNGATAYVTNNGSGTVTPISIATNTAGTAITVGGSLVGIAITPNGATAYVANGGAGTIIPINTTTNAVGSPITVGSGPHGIALTPDGATAYVANTSSSSVTPVNTSTNSPSTAISVGSGPFGIAISYTLPLPPPPPAPSSYESLALTPSAPSVAPGGSVTFTATFTNSSTSGTSSSTPISGASVSFNVSSGPDAGKTYTSTTNGLGVATYTYSNSGTPGTDSVSAGATDPSNGQVTIASSSIEFVAQDSLVLSPTSQPADVGTTVTITSQALDSSGKQLGGAVVAFTVTGGPDLGQSVTATTSSTGSATFSLSATKQGTDFISATLTDPTTSTQVTSNQVSVVWAAPIVIATIDPGSSSSLGVGSPVTLSVTLSSPVSALLRIHKSINLLKFLSELLLANSSGNTNLPDPGIPVSFSITSGPDTGHSGTSTTNSSGTASWTYRGSSAGTDIITASFADSAGISHSTSMSVNWATTSTTTAPTTSTTMPMTTTSAAPTTTILQISPTSPPSISQGGSTVGPATGQLSPTQLSSPQSTNPPTSPTTSQSITPTTQAFTKNKVNPVKSSKSSSNNNLVALGLASTASSYSSGANISRRIVKALVAAGHRGPDMAYGKGYGLGKGGGPPGVIPLAQSVPSPIEAFRSFTKTAGENSALAFLLIFLIGLPALIFNATLKKHHSNIVSTHGAIRRFVDRIELLLSKLHTGALLFLFALVGSLLYAIVDPTFGLNLSSLAEIIGFIGAIIVSTTVTEIARGAYVKKRFSKVGNLRAFPLGIVMALVFDIFSRLAHFEPGFVFGVLAALVFRVAPTREEDGRSIAWSAAWMMTISTICWFAWIPVKNLVIAGNHNFFILCVDALLSFVWICGLQSLFFGLIPIRSMDGETVFKWSKGAWAAMYLIVTFIFVQFMIHPSAAGFGGNKHTAILPLLAMFFTATLAAVGFWAYTNFKYGKTEEVSESVVENQEPSDSLA